SHTLQERLKYAENAVRFSKDLDVDTVILKSNRILSTVYLFIGDYEKFSKINHQNLEISKVVNDTLANGIANHNLGFYHSTKTQNDSAYYYYTKAILSYDKVGEISRKIEAMSNLSLIQHIERDYFGSEELCIRALRLLEDAPANQENLAFLWILYNRLGNISLDLGQLAKSLEYHEKAIGITKRMKNDQSDYYTSINNKALVL